MPPVLYTIDDSGGQEYTSIDAAVTQAEADWNGTPLTDPIEFRIWPGTYTEQISIDHTKLISTPQYPLRFWAQDPANRPVLNYSAANSIFVPSSSAACLSFKSLYLDHARNWYLVELVGGLGPRMFFDSCYVSAGGGTIPAVHSGTIVNGKDTEFAGRAGSYYPVAANAAMYLRRCKLSFLGSHASWNRSLVASPTVLISESIFDGTNKSAVNYALVCAAGGHFINNVVYGGNYGLGGTGVYTTYNGFWNIFNNIFSGQTTAAVDLLKGYEAPIACVEGNVFHNQSGEFLIDRAGSYNTLGELQAAGYDIRQKCRVDDPLLDSPFTGKIGAASPCIMAGVSSGAYKDYWGNTFNESRPSIGADAQWDTPDTVPTFSGVTSVIDNGDGSLTITWGEAADEDHFRIYLKDGSAPADIDIACIAPADAASCRIKYKQGTALTVGGDWYARVNAFSSSGVSDGNTATAHAVLTDTTAGALAVAGTSYTPVQLGLTATDIYTCPPGATAVVTVEFCNTDSSPRTFSFGLVRSGDAYGDDILSIKTLSLDAAGGIGHYYCHPHSFTLNAGDKIQGLASAAGVVNARVTERVRFS